MCDWSSDVCSSDLPRRIEARRDPDGSSYLAVPLPSREALSRFTDGVVALLRSVQQ